MSEMTIGSAAVIAGAGLAWRLAVVSDYDRD